MPCQVPHVEFVCASQDSTGGKACSGNRRLQRGIHAQTTDRRRAHLRGTTTRMGQKLTSQLGISHSAERLETTRSSVPELLVRNLHRDLDSRNSRPHRQLCITPRPV